MISTSGGGAAPLRLPHREPTIIGRLVRRPRADRARRGRAARPGRLPARRGRAPATSSSPPSPNRTRCAAAASPPSPVACRPSPTPPRCSTARTSTPSSSPRPRRCHLDDARRAAARGLPVLVEKPPAPDRRRCRGAGRARPRRRSSPSTGGSIPRSRRCAQPRRPGRRCSVIAEIAYRRGGWGPHAVADDALLDLGPHLVDLARWITGAEVTGVLRAEVTPERAAFDLELGAARARIRCADGPPAPRARRDPRPRRRTGRPAPRRRSGGRGARQAAPRSASAGRLAHRGAGGVRPHRARRAGSRARPGRRRRRGDDRARRGPRPGHA